ncbi:MAG: N-6 DNA methylase [Candidatus Aenigmarchaeota archaeon]|nr:N-6 DNA methylase [Candidatus Aenigmarchaeota archaeon]
MEEPLFNPRTVKRLVSDIKISAKQKRAAEDWLNLLKEGKLEKEKQGYFPFANILLRDLLGYDISLESLKHEDKHMEFSFEDKTGSKFVCFEAKGTKTEDLWASQHRNEKVKETPVNQVNHYIYELGIPYGVLTNYKIFVLFDRSVGSSKFHKFDFCSIRENPEKLKEFVAIFSRESLEGGFVEKLSEASKVEERNFTKEFYKLFHETRLMMLKEFRENGISREDALHYAQLYLNRLMFTFFAEDTDKLSERLFEKMVTDALKMETLLSDRSNYVSATISDLFGRMNEGSETPVKIQQFNGGLFKEEIPQTVYFKDFRDSKFFAEVYKNSTLKKEPELDEATKPIFTKYQNKLSPIIKNLLLMASFDFKTEVNVNILGHIFEQSLSDLEELKEGSEVSKRKKDGIFYTPEYITDYICRNTIIPYLSKKEAKTAKELVKEYSSDISELEEKFRRIKILDPACGSGAFLIKAVDVLLEIQKEIQNFKQEKGEYFATGATGSLGSGKRLSAKDKQMSLIGESSKWVEEDEAREIIQNNIFGVDINEESVEITKLSLFLKIAKKNKKLISLDKNIKCGNSLIDDKSVDPKAFKWEEEFSEIMSKGGFDVVIGNPPYVNIANISDENTRTFYQTHYATVKNKSDLYSIFTEKGKNLLKKEGLLSFIFSNSWLGTDSFSKFREFLVNETEVLRLIKLPPGVFEDAIVTTTILTFQNKIPPNNHKIELLEYDNGKFDKMNHDLAYERIKRTQNLTFSFEPETIFHTKTVRLGEIANFSLGIKTSDDERFILEAKKDNDTYPVLRGKDIDRYYSGKSKKWIWYKPKLMMEKVGAGPRKIEYFKVPSKILFQGICGGSIKASIDTEKHLTNDKIHILYYLEKNYRVSYILALVNSKFIDAWLNSNFNKLLEIKINQLQQIPIPEIPPSEQKPFIEKADKMLKLNKEFYEKRAKFLDRVAQNLKVEKSSKRVENFHELAFSDFLAELAKKKVKLTLKEQDEWSEYFEGYKKDLTGLKQEIEKTDREIDQMVYKLYGLTEEEIKIVERSLK